MIELFVGFTWLQDMIDRAFIDYHSNATILEPGTWFNQMPYPCYTVDNFLQMIQHVMPLCLSISFVYSVAMLSQTIVLEKELRLNEMMKIMGLSNAVHMHAWFITYFIQFSVITSIVTCILHYGKILTHSDPLLIFAMLEVFSVATICFSFMVSAMYSRAKLAAACAGILYFLSYVPCMYISIKEDVGMETVPWIVKMFASFLSTSAFGIVSKYIAFYENEGTGLQWRNMHQSPLEGDSFNCSAGIKIMLFDCVLYWLLACYIENVNPKYGVALPLSYPFKRFYWIGNLLRRKPKLSHAESEQALLINNTGQKRTGRKKCLLEQEPPSLAIGVSIQNLTKIYEDSKVAVDNLSVNFYENQISSFLGHNGAGKTTIISCLTGIRSCIFLDTIIWSINFLILGLFQPSSGHALIYNKDIRTDSEEIRKNLGYCPQYNVREYSNLLGGPKYTLNKTLY